MKIKATISLQFEAPAGSDPWALIRDATTAAILALHDCREKKPDIVSVHADGKAVTFKGFKRTSKP
jgi:hypothetical protein